MQITLVQTITIAIALLGAVLGIINTWQSLSRSRLRIRVVPKQAIPVGGAPSNINFCIEITNFSEFAVSISGAGFLHRHTDARSAIISPVFSGGGNWPRRLEPRSSVTAYCEVPLESHKIKTAYAETECGHLKTGSTPALKKIIRG